MRVLWISNIIFPEVCDKLNLAKPSIGGWMYSLLESLKSQSTIEFSVATTYKGDTLQKYTIDNVVYYLLPLQKSNLKYNRSLELYWQTVVEDFKPDLVHIHGTEYALSLPFLIRCKNVKTIVSIQGIVSKISDYYEAGIKKIDIFKNITFRDILRFDTIFQGKQSMFKRGQIEKEIIKKTNFIMGRTQWDRSHTFFINPSAPYFFCNETLRSGFYDKQWSISQCEKYSIFISQARIPIKGLHKVIEAVALIKHEFPEIKIYIAGNKFTKKDNLIDRIRLTGYGKYILSLIKKNNLKNHIVFTGELNEEEMIDRYLKSNLFICPSSIENSPNSLGEAQILGVPCIASYVGGVSDMVKDGETGFLYRFEEVEMLALKMAQVFQMSSNDLDQLSNSEREVALKRHNRKDNIQTLLDIYSQCLR